MDGGFRDWLAGLSRREVALLSLVGLAFLAGAWAWYARSTRGPIPVEAPQPVVAPSPSLADVVVHVAGRVRRPGVYDLPAGSRVVDAIQEAGGPSRGAALEALNLAAVLTDGQQVLVPRRAPGGGPAGPVSAPGAGGEVMGKVNVNTADAAALDTLPGIGEVLAARIIEYRERNGPFATVDDLIDVSGIGEVTLEELRPLVTV